jgi:ABC-2 type transport system permease protein
MKNLFYKEFRLWWHPALYLWLLSGSWLLFPNRPFFIAFSFIFLAFHTAFPTGRINQDVFFTASLPVRKKDIVLARICFMAGLELLQIIVAIPFAIINSLVFPNGNVAGMNSNFAFFGFVLIMYAIFNIIYLPSFYKTAYQVSMPIILAILAVLVYVVTLELTIAFVPILRTNLDGLGASHLASQLPLLIAGIVLFILMTLFAYQISANRFEKADL